MSKKPRASSKPSASSKPRVSSKLRAPSPPNSARLRFERLPGTARNYFDTHTGRTITRRERDKIVDEHLSQAKKPVSYERLIRSRYQRTRYQDLLQTYVDKQLREGRTVKTDAKAWAKKGGVRPYTVGDARKDSRFKHLVKELDVKTVKGKPHQPRLKAALIELGRREHIPFAVPPGQSAKFLYDLSRAALARGEKPKYTTSF